jgi:hypothetical protein
MRFLRGAIRAIRKPALVIALLRRMGPPPQPPRRHFSKYLGHGARRTVVNRW